MARRLLNGESRITARLARKAMSAMKYLAGFIYVEETSDRKWLISQYVGEIWLIGSINEDLANVSMA